ncbi:MAG: SDR family oxidoreductase [Anaerolineales bacterium]|nr:SDR family oxidoreductase [Anaerolineales bacterium]
MPYQKKAQMAIVTGAAHRLGKIFAVSLARRGYGIILHYFNSEEEALATETEIRSLGVPVWLVKADLTDSAQIDQVFELVDDTKAELRILINSAAVMKSGDVRRMTADEWDATLQLNLRAPFFCAQQAAHRMGNGGLIVNLTDVGAMKAWSGFPAYTISKAGLEAMTRVLARTLAPHIRVNAIAPGLVLPTEKFSPKDWNQLVAKLPLPRAAAPDELSSALEFILENEYITGQTITVDGGYSLV